MLKLEIGSGLDLNSGIARIHLMVEADVISNTWHTYGMLNASLEA